MWIMAVRSGGEDLPSDLPRNAAGLRGRIGDAVHCFQWMATKSTNRVEYLAKKPTNWCEVDLVHPQRCGVRSFFAKSTHMNPNLMQLLQCGLFLRFGRWVAGRIFHFGLCGLDRLYQRIDVYRVALSTKKRITN